MVKIAVFVSGGGTNLQALLDAEQEGKLGQGKISLVLSSSANAYALTRAQNAGVPTAVFRKKDYADEDSYTAALTALMQQNEIGLIVLAGFLTVLPAAFCKAYANKIINVHPSLIPSFCGEGCYGLRVHQMALDKGVKVSGATVHFVSEVVDGGAIIAQKAVDVLAEDTPESLQQRVMREAEWVILPQAVADFCNAV